MSSKLNYPINFFPQDMELHTSKNKCNLCKCKFNKTAHKKTKYHYHYLKENNYTGTLCTMCNLKLRTPYFSSCSSGVGNLLEGEGQIAIWNHGGEPNSYGCSVMEENHVIKYVNIFLVFKENKDSI